MHMVRKKSIRNGAIATTLALSTVLSFTTIAQADTGTGQQTPPSPTVSATSQATVTVNAASTLDVVPQTALGVNTAVWDGPLMGQQVPSLLRRINAVMLRYPGGSTSDLYNWQTNTVQGGYADPNDNFTNFMKLVQQAHGQAIITVNGGTGTAAEAAAWVKDANVTNHYGVKYWEIGNELYGSWEAGNFAGNPDGYAKLASTYIQQMKAVDPSIKIGVDLIAPGTGDSSWNSSVLAEMKALGTMPDFAIVHWYAQNPGGESDAGLLSSTNQISTMMSTLNQQLSPYGNMPIFVTETNSVSSNPGKQSTSLVNALFLDDDMANWLQAGVANVDWWDLYNGIVTGQQGANVSSSLYGSRNYGDYGLLSNGSSANGISEPPVNTPFPDYYGYQMLGGVIRPGATLVASGSNTPMIASHASVMQNGDVSVMLINKDPKNAYQVNLNLQGITPRGPVTAMVYGEGSQGVATVPVQNPNSITVAPYSITDIIMQGGRGFNPPGHGPLGHRPQGQSVTDSTTLSSASIKPGNTETVTTTFKNTRGNVHNANLVVQIDNASGQIVAEQEVPNVSIPRGQSASPVTLNWSVPDIQGNYTVRAFAFGRDGSTTLLSDENAATFTVTQPDPPVVSATVYIPAKTVKVGTPLTITTTYTETAPTGYLTNGLLVQYAVYDNWASSQQQNPSASLSPGQTVTETWNWTPTKAGTYIFPEGIFTSSWKQIQWINQPNVTLTVTN